MNLVTPSMLTASDMSISVACGVGGTGDGGPMDSASAHGAGAIAGSSRAEVINFKGRYSKRTSRISVKLCMPTEVRSTWTERT